MQPNEGEAPAAGSDARPEWKPNRTRIVVLAVIALLLLDFGSFMFAPAQLEIFERIICQNINTGINAGNATSQPPSGDFCKSVPVQSELGIIVGYKEMFETIPGEQRLPVAMEPSLSLPQVSF